MNELLLILLVIGAVYFPGRVRALERRVRRLVPVAAPAPQPNPEPQAAPAPAPARAPSPAPARRTVAQRPTPAFDWGRTLGAADLLGAKALAFAGGVVTLLGVVFFFVLAVNRGWIGPELRVLCGGLASAPVFGGGVLLEGRLRRPFSQPPAVRARNARAYPNLPAAAALAQA